MFQLLSDQYLFEPVIAEALTARPEVAMERALTTLRAMAAGGGGYASGNAYRWMKETGVGLWNDMVPNLIKQQFWDLHGNIAAFSIATKGDAIPWELLYPLSHSSDDGFLVEQFPVLRRVFGQHRSRSVGVGEPLYVVSSKAPSNASNEVDAILN